MIQLKKDIIGPGMFRFILASAVVFFHVTSFIYFGSASVFAFFIQSGYLVTKMYCEKYNKKEISLKQFYLSRALKIYPTYYFISILALIVNYLFKVPNAVFNDNILSYFSHNDLTSKAIFVFSSVTLIGYNFLNFKLIYTAWSLDVEIQFYLVLPLVVYLIEKLSLKVVAAVVILLSILSMYFSSDLLMQSLPFYGSFFLVGILIYRYPVKVPTIFATLSLMLCFIIIGLHYLTPQLRNLTMNNHDGLYCSILNIIIPLTLIPFIMSNIKIKSNSSDRFFGDISYVIYLLHPLLILPYSILVKNVTMFHKVLLLLLYLGVTFLLSYLFYTCVDKKFNLFRQRITNMAGKVQLK